MISDLRKELQLPEILDEHGQFYCLQATSDTLGAPVEYKNQTLFDLVNGTKTDNMKRMRRSDKIQIMSYNSKTNSLMIDYT